MKHNSVPLVFAESLSGGIVHINDVERGLSCKAKCPKCGSPLQARKGEKNTWHFSHHDTSEECPGSSESGLHRAAKEIIRRSGKIFTPNSFRRKQFYEPRSLELTSIIVEDAAFKSTHGYQPDISAMTFGGTQPIHIEIHVTNKVSASKASLSEASGIPMLEVHVNASDHEAWDWVKLESSVIESIHNKRWVGDYIQESLEHIEDASTAVQVDVNDWLEPLEDSMVKLSFLTATVWVRKFDDFVTLGAYHSPWAPILLGKIAGAFLDGKYSSKYKNWSTSRYDFRQVVKVVRLAHGALEEHGQAIGYGLSTDRFNELWPTIQNCIAAQLGASRHSLV